MQQNENSAEIQGTLYWKLIFKNDYYLAFSIKKSTDFTF